MNPDDHAALREHQSPLGSMGVQRRHGQNEIERRFAASR
jgi:hypothetical protein